MSRTTKFAALAAAGVTALALASPAAAVPGTVRSGSATGPAYSGAITATLVGTATINAGGTTATCTAITLSGTTTSGGAVTFASPGSFTCGGTPVSLNSGATGNLAYNAGGSTASLSNFKLTAIVAGFVSCTYGGNFTNLPVSNPISLSLNGVVANKTAGSFLCPSSATVTATFAVTTGSGGALHLTA